MLSVFSLPIGHLYVFSGEISQVCCPFAVCFLLLSCMSCLYILEINPLGCITNVFSQSIGYFFILFMVSFALQKLINLISGSDSKASACNAGDPGSIPGSGRSLEEGLATHSNIFAGKSHGQWNLADYSPWDRQESDMTELLTHTSLPL